MRKTFSVCMYVVLMYVFYVCIVCMCVPMNGAETSAIFSLMTTNSLNLEEG